MGRQTIPAGNRDGRGQITPAGDRDKIAIRVANRYGTGQPTPAGNRNEKNRHNHAGNKDGKSGTTHALERERTVRRNEEGTRMEKGQTPHS